MYGGKDFWDRGYSSNQKVLWIKENHRIAEENGIQDSFVERDRKFVLKGVGILEFVGYFFPPSANLAKEVLNIFCVLISQQRHDCFWEYM